MKRVVCLSVLVLFVFGAVSFSSAKDACCAAVGNKSEAVDVGNKICPVSGEKINEKTKATYEYEGKIYNFCCPACISSFKKNPEKYIKKIEEEKIDEEKSETGGGHIH